MGMWANKVWIVGLAGTFLFAATVLPPDSAHPLSV
jgi:hypothetical protein